jgi:uncharacterized repeat protein (TIGR03803 family)
MITRLTILGVVLLIATGAWAGTETVLYSFSGGSDGAYGGGLPARDSSGTLYGTTLWGGSCDDGTVFELSSDGTETVLYNFCGSDGSDPFGDVTLDSSGTIYGTTYAGGSNDCGTVWKLSGFTLTTLHTFTCGNDGGSPWAGVILDASGNLYGTTYGGGTSNNGVAYEISNSGTFSVIHNFCTLSCADGASPNSLAIDAAGDLYGTTSYGGNLNCTDGNGSGCGTVFELSGLYGRWREKVLHSFGYRDGITPIAGPTLATIKSATKMQHVIFGVTYLGSGDTGGNVFEMDKSKSGYTFRVIHRFTGAEGCCSTHALTIARSSLYGTASLGGSGGGTVFKLVQKGKYWTDTVLYSFTGGSDGKYPISGVAADSSGNLYGEAQGGGSTNCYSGCGVVYEVKP